MREQNRPYRWGSLLLSFIVLISTVLLPVKTYAAELKLGPGQNILGGASLTLLANQTDSQMLSVVIQTRQGSVIVVDGGTEGDTAHLVETIQSKGGKVAAWLITHPHSDHAGALKEILNNPERPIAIDHIYYSFAEEPWYTANEAYRAALIPMLHQAFSTLPAESIHGDIQKGQEIWVDDVKITVMNQPYLFTNNAINNSSVAYRLDINGLKAVFLGDMGPEAGASLLQEYEGQDISCDILQMAHHGQYGVNEDVYRRFNPQICLWPTPGWLWDNNNGGGINSGPWFTLETRQWMNNMGVKYNLCIKDGDQIIQ